MRGFLSITVVCTAMATFGVSQGQAQTVGYGEAIGAMTAVCSADLERNCKGVKPGAGALRACLVNNQANVSQECLSTMEVTVGLLAKRAAAQEAVPQ
ncbi:MAG: hypothetical protein GY798_18175, partial [Hyphomicrobiales bacterium]|nr:hypothetical protein [Hyphomicrobiales bacterium]